MLVARQRDLAERNLAFARTVVDEMYTRVAEKLDDQEQMDDYQREILEKALAFYERFALPQSRDPQVRLEAARAGLRVGGIRSRLGQTAAAEQADRQALEILSRLASEHPAEPAYRDALAQAHRELGDFFEREERWREAEGEIKEAVALWECSRAETPEIAEYRSETGRLHFSLGRLYRSSAAYEETEAEYRLALDARNGWSRKPRVIAYQESLAAILGEYVKFQSQLNDLAGQRSDHSVRAVAIGEPRSRSSRATKYRDFLAIRSIAWGTPTPQERKFPQAEADANGPSLSWRSLSPTIPRIWRSRGLWREYCGHGGYPPPRGDFRSALEWAGRAIPLLRSLARRDPRNQAASPEQISGNSSREEPRR